MTKYEYPDILHQGVDVWNQWRQDNPNEQPNLSEADLSGRDLTGIDFGATYLLESNLQEAKLHKAFLATASLFKANLVGADLSEADLGSAILAHANLTGANLNKAELGGANLSFSVLSRADLRGANLNAANLIRADLQGANLTGASVYGISAWDVNLEGAIQSDLDISPYGPSVTVDNLEVAQFVYLLMNSQKIRSVIDTITSKVVLILGRFTPERKAILNALRDELRHNDYVPIVFDFERPTDRDFTETVMILAGMCRFIIADITNPSSSPLELQTAVPDYMIPFVPILQRGEKPFSMFANLKAKYDWVLDLLIYDSIENLIRGLKKAVIVPALEKHADLMTKKAQELKFRDIQDYL